MAAFEEMSAACIVTAGYLDHVPVREEIGASWTYPIIPQFACRRNTKPEHGGGMASQAPCGTAKGAKSQICSPRLILCCALVQTERKGIADDGLRIVRGVSDMELKLSEIAEVSAGASKPRSPVTARTRNRQVVVPTIS